jgi:hypothetical protein
MVLIVRSATGPRPTDQVRLVYYYRDGHDFVIETMLRAEAAAHMPLLHAILTDPEHYEAAFATIELGRAQP